jgi:CxxC motif-containing protein (DUF1111 family)
MFDDCQFTRGVSDYHGRDEDPIADPEVSEEYIDLLAAFLTGLAPPPTNGEHPAVEALFAEIGCTTCHRPDLGPQAPGSCTDLCLHDMGPNYATFGIDGNPGPQDFRTTPLWGLRHRLVFLQGGQAQTVHDAIIAHRGEAETALVACDGLSEEGREDLLAFLNTS